ncbi:S8 family serine peptidase [Paractinoplanes atraurantiacus]|uniref:Serine protease, subtilisin family n=1 Tax=Paractinoplanes atraurantiacus TaxID=1036182 RepID=A0A285KEP8_9ACTN|nr:S8 family serine peptidase [Actinoplanes atraurantiacus]SNY69751.1 Serine protease, subtilisin family [Actinoplanes atraurantiacus]
MRKVRITSALALTGVALWAAFPAGAFAATATTPPATAAGSRSITLITGDTVHLGQTEGQTTVGVTPAPGREKIPFLSAGAGDDVRVIPADAAPLLAQGRLDPRLFDVSTLVKFGYDDTRRTLPLLIEGTATPAGGSRTRALPGTGVTAYAQDRSTPATLWRSLTDAGTLRSGVSKVWLDGLRQPALDVSVPMIGAPAAWQAGLTGAGVKVAVLDSGVDLAHPDLAGQVAEAVDFTGGDDLADRSGHGTHVASTIAGTGAASGGRYKGVAPGAKLLSAKVCLTEGCPESAILAGMAWAAERGATVANLSLGGEDTPEIDPLEAAVNEVTARTGMLFVIAAGNSGEGGDVTINSPGSADAALTVGAVAKDKSLAEFSSRGPRLADAEVKPDITAPGVGIVAARSADGQFPPVDGADSYTQLNGTSMATPHVAGAVALLAQKHPGWRAAQLKATLTASAAPAGDQGPYAQGSGLTDVARAITQTVTAAPGSLAFQRTSSAQTRTVTYRNGGPSAVTLTLAVDPLFKLSTTKVTVPAGGTGAVTVTAPAGTGLADEPLGGELIATAGATRVVTPVGLDIVRFTLTLRTTGADNNWITLLTDLERHEVLAFAHDGAADQVRVRQGRYVLQSYRITGDPYSPDIVSLNDPNLVMSADRTVSLDTEPAKPVAIKVADRKAVPAYNEAGWTMRTEKPQIWGSNDPFSTLMNIDFARLRTGPVVGSGKAGGYVSYVTGAWAHESNYNSPAVYHVYLYERGRMMSGKTKTLGPGDFAKVTSRVGVDVPDVQVSRVSVGRVPGNSPVTRSDLDRSSPLSFLYDGPRTVVDYYNQDQQTLWGTTSAQPGYTYYQADWRSFRPGRSYSEDWALGVIGPVFPQPDFAQQFATRYDGDVMGGPGPLHGDGAGHEGFRHTRDGAVDVRVYRNGRQVAQSSQPQQAWFVPSAAGDYRMTAKFSSAPQFTRSTVVDAEWTFRSGHVADGELVALPMTAIRFTPRLDLTGAAPDATLFTIPISLDRQVGAARAVTRSLTVDASYDDGRTWHRLPVLRLGEKATAVLHHPKGTGYVSLRASAADSAGNTAKETILRAYSYR